mmetsp:Transcript_36059/g.63676  ORF Transcript_36059/g.63676 Transcript_36059/m.63676 type:complete len:86 (-) Transcript_36059:24-281(-)
MVTVTALVMVTAMTQRDTAKATVMQLMAMVMATAMQMCTMGMAVGTTIQPVDTGPPPARRQTVPRNASASTTSCINEDALLVVRG